MSEAQKKKIRTQAKNVFNRKKIGLEDLIGKKPEMEHLEEPLQQLKIAYAHLEKVHDKYCTEADIDDTVDGEEKT